MVTLLLHLVLAGWQSAICLQRRLINLHSILPEVWKLSLLNTTKT